MVEPESTFTPGSGDCEITVSPSPCTSNLKSYNALRISLTFSPTRPGTLTFGASGH